MAKKKKKIKRMSSITTPPFDHKPKANDVDDTITLPKETSTTITITKTLGMCPVCKAESAYITRYMRGDIYLYATETMDAYDVTHVEEITTPRKYYDKNKGKYITTHRMVVTCSCAQCNSTWTEDYDTAIPTDVYNIIDNSETDHSTASAAIYLEDVLSGYPFDEEMRDISDDDDDDARVYYGGATKTKKDKVPLPPYIADPTPLYFETSITKTMNNTSKGDKK